MRAAHPKRKPRAIGRRLIIELDLGEHVCSILGDFQKRYMLHPEANHANAAKFMVETALMDYERTLERALQVEQYCKAEGIESQEDFPEDEVPARPRAAPEGGKVAGAKSSQPKGRGEIRALCACRPGLRASRMRVPARIAGC